MLRLPRRWRRTGAHPRSRGENNGSACRPRRRLGSSPLTRGKSHRLLDHAETPGLIPAHAGKMRPRHLLQAPRRAHPRSRGENPSSRLDASTPAGSSPLTRGKFVVVRVSGHHLGLIPAHAGKISFRGGCGGCGGAHPRSRGENRDCGLAGRGELGSSPLTRGKYDLRHSHASALRLIPAHAGKIRTRRKDKLMARAHPRSRGENT